GCPLQADGAACPPRIQRTSRLAISRRDAVIGSRAKRTGRTALALAALALGASATASANDGGSRFQLGPPSYGSSSYDRTFIREWEANPPKGYATLSTANIEATKAAIKRYESIVKDGGWKPVPEVQVQAGATNAAVSLLRERLA